MLPYHPNPLPSCRRPGGPAEDRGARCTDPAAGMHHARTIPRPSGHCCSNQHLIQKNGKHTE
eukprot:728600-Hanusia_phi.AAC.1